MSFASPLDVELVGHDAVADVLSRDRIERLCEIGCASSGVDEAHLAIAFVDADEIAALNEEHRGKTGPTDVLSFPMDGDGPVAGPRELGDVVICPEHTSDLDEAVLHGVLHLLGMDHETDGGEMLALQKELLTWTP